MADLYESVPVPPWVGQKHEAGCGVAVLAMITNRPYDYVYDELKDWNADLSTWGMTHFTIDRYLARDGWYGQRRFDAYEELPKEPFAPIHYAEIKQPSGRLHFVVVCRDGMVLDPARDGEYTLTDYPQVMQLVGLIKEQQETRLREAAQAVVAFHAPDRKRDEEACSRPMVALRKVLRG